MYIFMLWLFFFSVYLTSSENDTSLKSRSLTHDKFKRHTVTGRKGVVETYPNTNATDPLVSTELFILGLRSKRSTHHHHRAQIHSNSIHHHKLREDDDDDDEKDDHPKHKGARHKEKNKKSRRRKKFEKHKIRKHKKPKKHKPTKKPKTTKKPQITKKPKKLSWIDKIKKKFHIKQKIPESETKKTWYVTKNKKPFMADVDLCLLDQCYNEGTCISDPGSPYGYRCICPPGIVGEKCQTVIHTCKLRPCQNGGTCKPKHSRTKYRYFCECPKDYAGELCEESTNKNVKINPPGRNKDFFDERRERNKRAENLIAVSITILVLTILFIIFCFVFQICKRKRPPPKAQTKRDYEAVPLESDSEIHSENSKPSTASSEQEFSKQEVYCPLITKLCRHCCEFFLEKKPAPPLRQRLTVVKKAGSCGQLTMTSSGDMAAIKPRHVSSDPIVNYNNPASKNSDDDFLTGQLPSMERMALEDRSRVWLHPGTTGMSRVKPTEVPEDTERAEAETATVEAVTAEPATVEAPPPGQSKAETAEAKPGEKVDSNPGKTVTNIIKMLQLKQQRKKEEQKEAEKKETDNEKEKASNDSE